MIKITKEEFILSGPHYCQHGCKKEIQWKQWYSWRGIPLYLHGHNPSKTTFKKGHMSANKGKHLSEITKNKISKSNKGKSRSEETRRKMSDTRKGWIFTDETKAKLKITNAKENHPNWQGGISFLPYCKNFDDELKKTVRERDNYVCKLCYSKENNRVHSVHHIHYLKEECEPDLITLCTSCNSKVNFNRDYYEKLFMNLLNERGLLFWTRDYFTNKKLYYCFKFLFS